MEVRGAGEYDEDHQRLEGEEKEIVMISPLGFVHQPIHHRLTGTAKRQAFMGAVGT